MTFYLQFGENIMPNARNVAQDYNNLVESALNGLYPHGVKKSILAKSRVTKFWYPTDDLYLSADLSSGILRGFRLQA